MGVGTKTAQIILFILNLILIICGLAMIIIGAIAFTKADTMFHLTGVSNGAAIFLIVVGCILVVVALFGCCGAWNRNFCLLMTYCAILGVLLILVIAVIIFAFVLKDKISNESITEELRKSIPKYDSNEAVRSTWDSLQRDNQCCGSNNYNDWAYNKFMNETNRSVPDSCCTTPAKNCGVNQLNLHDKINTKGCVTSLLEFTQKNFQMIGIIAIITAIILLFGIILAAFLAHQIRHEYNTV